MSYIFSVPRTPCRPAKLADPGDKECTTYHESGHAVVGLTIGGNLERVTIVPTATSKGLCLCLFPESLGEVAIRERRIILYFAGPLAVSRLAGVSIHSLTAGGRGCQDGDLSRIEDELDHLAKSHEDRRAIWRRLYARTADIVFSGDGWSRIKAVAAELLKRQTLTGEEVGKIVPRPY